MTLHRALWSLPLALAVAVLAHLAVFGTTHAPGAGHAPDLLGVLAVALGLTLAGAFFAGATAPKHLIATETRFGYAPLGLAAAAAVAFGLIELSEGRLAAGPWLLAMLTMLPLAFGVVALARGAGAAARRAGVAFAAFARTRRFDPPALLMVRRAPVLVRIPSTSPGARRGRAPPSPR